MSGVILWLPGEIATPPAPPLIKTDQSAPKKGSSQARSPRSRPSLHEMTWK